MFTDRGLAFKLGLVVSASAIAVFLGAFGCFYTSARRIVLRHTEIYARQLTSSTVDRIESILRPVAKVPESLAVFMENSRLGEDDLERVMRSALAKSPDIFGCAVAFEPRGFRRDRLYFAPYYYRDKGSLRFKSLGGRTYRYFDMDWYKAPRELHQPVWTEPYMDKGGGDILMATYSAPFYRKAGGRRRLAGVVTADISLERLNRLVSAIKVLKSGDGFLISKNGAYITQRSGRLVMKQTIFSVAEEKGDPALREIGLRMTRGETGFTGGYRSIAEGRPSQLFYAPVPSAGWSLGVVFPNDELMADVHQLSWTVSVLAVAGLVLILLVVAWESSSITGPLREMARATEAVSAGNLDFSLPPPTSRDEVGRLTEAFGRMRGDLKDYIRRLTETTAAKQRIESELGIAREIQMNILPKIFPPEPDLPELDLFAILEPAREVGGDLYDFYPLDNGRFCFVVGDVSGKGVPAALFMAVTKTLLKTCAAIHPSADDILTRVNDDLAAGNEKAMFVTLFLGIIDLNTGEVEYCNGGHAPPLVLRASGEMAPLAAEGGPLVGALPGRRYAKARVSLKPGDRLFLYTDGVPEAEDRSGGFFGEERLLEALRALWDRTPKEMAQALVERVTAFSKDEHSDDITVMALRFNGPGPRET